MLFRSECIPQASLKNLIGKSVILDVLCRARDGSYYNVEVQKSDDDDHQKRVRYNTALVSMYTMQAGKDYKELPEVKAVSFQKLIYPANDRNELCKLNIFLII